MLGTLQAGGPYVDLPHAGLSAGHRPIGRHVHVLLHSTNGNDADDREAVQCLEPFRLADRMWICRMPDYLRDIVYKACESPGEPYEAAHRQYGQLYTIALFMGPPEIGTVTSWDGYGHLSREVTY